MSTMKLAGFNFTKILIEKKKSDLKDLKISSGIHIDNISEAKSPIKTKESFLAVKWKFEATYNPEIAKIEFEGNVLVGLDSNKAKEVLKSWTNKKVDEDFNLAVINVILRKSNIKALQLEDEFGLPAHFKLPSLKAKK
ncbi:MAG: hypothetical protein ACE5RF_03515 [Nitrosarchaeum sp.]